MRVIGITGGAGAGKSEILRFIEKEYDAKVVLADVLAQELMQPGTDCFKKICAAFGAENVCLADGSINRAKLAADIFSDSKKRLALNAIVHPAVKRRILAMIDEERNAGIYSYFILEAALLIEDGYDKICDELWYIDASRQIRRRRLKEGRGYSDEKTEAVFASQLGEEEYRKHCGTVIENNGSLEEAFCRIRAALKTEKNDG